MRRGWLLRLSSHPDMIWLSDNPLSEEINLALHHGMVLVRVYTDTPAGGTR